MEWLTPLDLDLGKAQLVLTKAEFGDAANMGVIHPENFLIRDLSLTGYLCADLPDEPVSCVRNMNDYCGPRPGHKTNPGHQWSLRIIVDVQKPREEILTCTVTDFMLLNAPDNIQHIIKVEAVKSALCQRLTDRLNEKIENHLNSGPKVDLLELADSQPAIPQQFPQQRKEKSASRVSFTT